LSAKDKLQRCKVGEEKGKGNTTKIFSKKDLDMGR
jgi:hypothetical protein